MNGTSIIHSVEHDSTVDKTYTTIDTIITSITNWDTLLEISGQIIMKPTRRDLDGELTHVDNWWLDYYYWISRRQKQQLPLGDKWKTPIMPVWYQHFEDPKKDSIFGDYNKIHSENQGVFEIQRTTISTSGTESSIIYRQNVGLTSYHFIEKELGARPTIDIELLSFEKVSISNYIPHINHSHDLIRHLNILEVKFSLPHFSIENNNRVFNLQGRSFPSKTFKTNKRHTLTKKQP